MTVKKPEPDTINKATLERPEYYLENGLAELADFPRGM
jgi:hypothetical protein